ncbi:MAG: hypothetical protein RQ847_00015 [Wenzhouxiangellaceae bacterium]|nr:hypothetical protein [Wenzhouxiangellaceae bacterium]
MSISLKQRVWIALAAGTVLGVVVLAAIAFSWQRLESHPGWLAAGAGMVLVLLLWLASRMTVWALRPLAGASTVVEALRDGDYSLRLREAKLGGLDELAHSINLLADALRAKALNKRESGLLLGKILDEIELPVLAFRDDGVLTLSNPAARRLIGLNLHDGIDAVALNMDGLLEQDPDDSIRLVLPGGSGRFMVRRRAFRLGGVPHRLLVLAEVGGVLSAERNEAWQGLVRVMSHEINNSLSPIKSLAETWQTRIARDGDAVDTGALSRFVGLYAGLAKLPEPDRRPIDIDRLAAKIAALETRLTVGLDGARCRFDADADQPDTDQSGPKCCRGLRRPTRARGACALAPACRRTGTQCARQRSRSAAQRQLVRAVFHHQARRQRHRPGAGAAHRRTARRRAGTTAAR